MQEAAPGYEVFAIRYATREARRADHFIGGEPHDGPMPMDYFVGLIRGAGRTVVVDTGFTAAVAARRKRTFLRCPVAALRRFGVDPAAIEHVVLTHLHYDHVGNFSLFPAAEFHLQEPRCTTRSAATCATASLRIPSRSRMWWASSVSATRAVAPTPAHIVPGHDPLVMQRYRPPRPELAGIAARLDVAPRAAPP